jgi:NAD-dependent deacetylase
MTADVQRPMAFSDAAIAASASYQFESFAWVSQLVNFHASSSRPLNRCRRCSCVAPASATAQPNPGHKAFVEFAQRGQLHALITQNIDGLHQRAGLDSRLVIEVHGTTTEAACLSCGVRISMDEAVGRIAKGDAAPCCTACGGLLKPATISFGQTLPEDLLLRCQAAAQSCDLFIAVGSSLVVYPAAAFPALAKQAGARLIIINRTETPLDDAADLVLRGEIGLTLPALAGIAALGAG